MESNKEKHQKNTITKMTTVADDFTHLPRSSQKISVGKQKGQRVRFEGISSDDESDSGKKQGECTEETSVTTVVAKSTKQTDPADSARELIVQEECIEEMSVEKVVVDELKIETGIDFFVEGQRRLKDYIEKTLNNSVVESTDSNQSQEMPSNHPNKTSSCLGNEVSANVSEYLILFLPVSKVIRFLTQGESQNASDTDDCNESCEKKESPAVISTSGKCNKACSTYDPEEKDIMSELIRHCPPSGLSLLFETVSQFEINIKLMREIHRLRCEIKCKKLLIEQAKMESVKKTDGAEFNKVVMEELHRTNKEKNSSLTQDIDENNDLRPEDDVQEKDHVEPTKEEELNGEEATTSCNENLFNKSENTVTGELETNRSPNMCDLISVLGENNEATVIGLDRKGRDKNEEILKENGNVFESKREKFKTSVEDVNKNEVAQCEPLSKEAKIEIIMKNTYEKVENIMNYAKGEVEIITKAGYKSEDMRTKPTDEESVEEDDRILECRKVKISYLNEDVLKNGIFSTMEIDQNKEKDENLGDENKKENCESERTKDTVTAEATQKKTDSESEFLLSNKQYEKESKAGVLLAENEICEKAITRSDVSSDMQTEGTLSTNIDSILCPEVDTLNAKIVMTELDKTSHQFPEKENPRENHDNTNGIERKKSTDAQETRTDNDSEISQLNGQYIKESDQEIQCTKENGLSERATATTDESFDRGTEDKLMSQQDLSTCQEEDMQSNTSITTEFDKACDEFQEKEKQQGKCDNINGSEGEKSKNSNETIQTQTNNESEISQLNRQYKKESNPEMHFAKENELEKKAIMSTNECFDWETERTNMIKQGTSECEDADSPSEISVITESDKIRVESTVGSNEFTENILVNSNVSNLDKKDSQEFSFNDSSDSINQSTMSVDQSTVTDLSFDVTAEVHMLVVTRSLNTSTDDEGML